jgi:hypothetical protein
MLNGYFWLKFIHVGAVFAFLLPHGASGAASLLLEHGRDLAMRRFLLELSWKAQSASTPALFVVLLSGLGLGFWGGWWRYGWIWTALVIFLAVSAGMLYFSYRFDTARKAAGLGVSTTRRSGVPDSPSRSSAISLIEASGIMPV